MARETAPRSFERSNADRSRDRDNVQRDTTQRSWDRGTVQRDTTQRSWDGGNAERGAIQRGGVERSTVERSTMQRDGNWRGNTGRTVARNERSAPVVLPRGVERDRFHYVPGWNGRTAPYRAHESVTSYGRVDRYERWHGGYRVWIGGGLYPIFVPFDRWALFPLRVGLFIRFGGYWDPFGYWSVYDYAPYYGYYAAAPYYDGAYTSGVVHGVVESVDYRRGTMVINDDISRQFVTVLMPRDRRMGDVRPGDSVEFSGDWNRRGTFDAYRLERWDYGRDGYRDDYGDENRY